jgi:predicted DNA-binding transcriptional regulator YafY
VADFAEIAMEVLWHGAGVEVIEPEGLRALLKTEAANILRLF